MLPVTTNGHNIITHSRLRAMRDCARKHYFSYELGVRPDREEGYFRLGGMFHEGRDMLSNGATIQDVLNHVDTAYRTTIPAWVSDEETSHAWHTERVTCIELLRGWAWRWTNEPMEVIASEIQFNLPIVNPDTGAATPLFRFAGKIDRIVRLDDGRLAVEETKTTGSDIDSESDYWPRLRIDHQISGYLIAARALGYDVQTIIYDATRKPCIRPCQIPELDEDGLKIVVDSNGVRVRTKDGKKWRETGDIAQGYALISRLETPEEFAQRLRGNIQANPDRYFQRREIPRLLSDISDFRLELWQQMKALREAQRTGRWFRNPNSCITFGRCPYFAVCTQGLSLADELPQGFVRIDNVHTELKKEESLNAPSDHSETAA